MKKMTKIVSAGMLFAAVLSWPIQGKAQTQQEKEIVANWEPNREPKRNRDYDNSSPRDRQPDRKPDKEKTDDRGPKQNPDRQEPRPCVDPTSRIPNRDMPNHSPQERDKRNY